MSSATWLLLGILNVVAGVVNIVSFFLFHNWWILILGVLCLFVGVLRVHYELGTKKGLAACCKRDHANDK